MPFITCVIVVFARLAAVCGTINSYKFRPMNSTRNDEKRRTGAGMRRNSSRAVVPAITRFPRRNAGPANVCHQNHVWSRHSLLV